MNEQRFATRNPPENLEPASIQIKRERAARKAKRNQRRVKKAIAAGRLKIVPAQSRPQKHAPKPKNLFTRARQWLVRQFNRVG